jgi:hypothetical protein
MADSSLAAEREATVRVQARRSRNIAEGIPSAAVTKEAKDMFELPSVMLHGIGGQNSVSFTFKREGLGRPWLIKGSPFKLGDLNVI